MKLPFRNSQSHESPNWAQRRRPAYLAFPSQMIDNPEGSLYQPLDDNHVRLLKFDPQASTENDLRFNFKHFSISRSPPKYTAVSYTWGSSPATETVYVNNNPILVRPHVLKCLRTMVKPCEERQSWSLIWIDSICINQRDEKEKSSQIRLMSQIYSRATVVSVWLQSEYRDPGASQVATEHESGETQPIPQHLHIVFSPYWERAWVVQEFLLANQIHVYGMDCRLIHQDIGPIASWRYRSWFKAAHRTVSFRQIMTSRIRAQSHKKNQMKGHNTLMRLINDGPQSARKPFLRGLGGARHALSGFQGLVITRYDIGADLTSFSVRLMAYADTKCLLPQDKVFSMMSLLKDVEFRAMSRIFPDYHMPETLVVIISLTHIKAFEDPYLDKKLEETARANKARSFALRVTGNLLDLYKDKSAGGVEIENRLSLEVSGNQDLQTQCIGIMDLIDWLIDCHQ